MTTERLRQARHPDIVDIVDLLKEVFGVGDRWTPSAFWNFYCGDSNYTPDQSFVVEYDGRLVSHVRCSVRRIRVGEAVIQVGAVSSVATLPGFRGRGYATSLLKRVVRFMEQRGDDVAMLFTGIPTFYQPLGWVSYPQYSVQKRLTSNRRVLRDSIAQSAPTGAVSLRRLVRWRDVSQCRQLHHEGNRGLTLAVVRPAEWWTDAYPWSWKPSTDWFLVAAESDHVAEYLRLFLSGTSALIMDAAPTTGKERYFPSLLRHWLTECPTVRTITGTVPRDSVLDHALRDLPGETQEWESDGMMLRFVNRRNYLARLRPEIRRRQATLPSGAWPGRILVEADSGEMDVLVPECDGGGEQVDSPPTLGLTDQELFLLTLGYTEADRIIGVRSADLPAPALATLNHLFPARPQVFWAIDHF